MADVIQHSHQQPVKPTVAISLGLDTDELAQEYEVASEAQYKTGLVLLEKVGIAPGEHVLDVGAGTGHLASYVAGLVGQSGKVIGIDPLERRIDIAQKTRKTQNLSFAVGDAQDLSQFASASFDVVYLNGVFHWLPDQPGALGQFARVLKPGGRLAISTGSKDHPYAHEVIKTRVLSGERYRDYPESNGVAKHPAQNHFETLLNSAGFRSSVITLVPNVIVKKDAEAMIDFVDASTFGNFLGHLPEELRVAARDEMKLEYEKLRTDEGIRTESKRLFAVAVKA